MFSSRNTEALLRYLKTRNILVTKDASPTNLIHLGNAITIVSEVGGTLNHLAIACRELDIPYIRIDEATKTLKDGEYVELIMKPK